MDGFIRKKRTHRYDILIDISVGFSIYVYGWPLPDEHELYLGSRRSIFNIRVNKLGEQMLQKYVCEGVGQDLVGCCEHFVQLETHPSEENENRSFNGRKYYRSKNCFPLSKEVVCKNCSELLKKSRQKKKKRSIIINHCIQIHL